MNSFKRNLFAIVAFLSAIIGGLLILLNRKSNQNADLKSDKDLTVQKSKSTIVDSKVESAQKEIDKLEKEMKTKPKDDDDFWKDYTK
jgi:preprotein translocase subunit SecF